MISLEVLRQLALSFPETTEAAHFEKIAFKVKGKIFATYDAKANRVSIKLPEIQQDVFSKVDRSVIYPVDNKWGKQGWTFIELATVPRDLFEDALTTAYCAVAPKQLAERVRKDDIE